MKPVLFITGPTAIGKTNLAFYLAPRLQAQIINADSLQFYKGMDIGAAKPDFKKHPLVKCFLFDHIKPPKIYTAGQFEKDALQILKKILPRFTGLVVGGSGFYLKALEKGLYPIAKAKALSQKNWMEKKKSKGLGFLYQQLQKKDPEYALQVHPNDSYRIIRALSIKEKLSTIQKKFKTRPFPYPLLKIGLKAKKEILKKRVQLRIEEQIKNGLIEEVQNLKNQELEKAFPPLQSVGYKEVLLYLNGEIKNKSLLKEQILQRTMKLIKKQKSWLNGEKNIHWFDFDASYDEILKKILAEISKD